MTPLCDFWRDGAPPTTTAAVATSDQPIRIDNNTKGGRKLPQRGCENETKISWFAHLWTVESMVAVPLKGAAAAEISEVEAKFRRTAATLCSRLVRRRFRPAEETICTHDAIPHCTCTATAAPVSAFSPWILRFDWPAAAQESGRCFAASLFTSHLHYLLHRPTVRTSVRQGEEDGGKHGRERAIHAACSQLRLALFSSKWQSLAVIYCIASATSAERDDLPASFHTCNMSRDPRQNRRRSEMPAYMAMAIV